MDLSKKTKKFDDEQLKKNPDFLTANKISKIEGQTAHATFPHLGFEDKSNPENSGTYSSVYESLFDAIDGTEKEREEDQCVLLLAYLGSLFKSSPILFLVVMMKMTEPTLTLREMEAKLKQLSKTLTKKVSRSEISRYIKTLTSNENYYRFFATYAIRPPSHPLNPNLKPDKK